jgi:hypothetical protein
MLLGTGSLVGTVDRVLRCETPLEFARSNVIRCTKQLVSGEEYSIYHMSTGQKDYTNSTYYPYHAVDRIFIQGECSVCIVFAEVR